MKWLRHKIFVLCFQQTASVASRPPEGISCLSSQNTQWDWLLSLLNTPAWWGDDWPLHYHRLTIVSHLIIVTSKLFPYVVIVLPIANYASRTVGILVSNRRFCCQCIKIIDDWSSTSRSRWRACVAMLFNDFISFVFVNCFLKFYSNV